MTHDTVALLEQVRTQLEAKRPMEMTTILKDAEKFANSKAPEGVKAFRKQDAIIFATKNKNQRQDILDLKAATAKFLKSHHGDRKYKHVKRVGKNVWWSSTDTTYWSVKEALQTGIQIVKTDDETRSIVLGMG